MGQSQSDNNQRKSKFESPTFLSKPVNDYRLQWGFRESEASRQLRLETSQSPKAFMMGDPTEATFFSLLLKTMGAKRVVEVGVYTGYTTLLMAQAVKDVATKGGGGEAKVVALDITDEYCKEIGKKYWKEAGVEDCIDLRIGPALECLEDLLKTDGESSFDFAFIDADKGNYKAYYEALLKLVRPNGIIAIDNVLWSGRVAEPPSEQDDPSTVALREINQYVYHDDRVEPVLLPFADGVTLVRKK